MAVFLALKTFLPALKGHHNLVCSDNIMVEANISHQGQSQVTLPSQVCSTPPVMGTGQTLLTESSSCAGQTETRIRHAVQGQCISRRMENTSSNGSHNLVCLREGRGGPQKTTFTTQFTSRDSEMFWPTIGPVLTCTPSSRFSCFLKSSYGSGKSDAQSSWWPHSGGIRCGSPS